LIFSSDKRFYHFKKRDLGLNAWSLLITLKYDILREKQERNLENKEKKSSEAEFWSENFHNLTRVATFKPW
jgi:hypothetical protein